MTDNITNEYKGIVKKAQELLSDKEREWKPRYKGYLEGIKKFKRKIKVHEKDPLYHYTTISNESDNKPRIILRYKGQEVASLVTRNNETCLKLDKTTRKNNKEKLGINIPSLDNIDLVPWNSTNAKEFKNAFKPEGNKKNNSEHTVESALITEFNKKRKEQEKKIVGIQPIKLNGRRFQMPTPFKASELSASGKSNLTNALEKLQYSGNHGGGIDILARRKKGNKSYITVIELKYKEKNQTLPNPKNVMRQAIAYAVFIRELVRSDKANGKAWYKWFGMNAKSYDEPLTIKCVVAMPRIDNVDEMFEGQEISLKYDSKDKYPEDKLILHCITFKGKDISNLTKDKYF
jgi:hypothetical protein